MSEYLRYLCQTESVPLPSSLYIVEPSEPWMIEQLSSEFENIFPNVPIRYLSKSEFPEPSGLLVIAYDFNLPHELYQYLLELCSSARFGGVWIFLYEMRYRCIDLGTATTLWQRVLQRQKAGRILRVLRRLRLMGPLVEILEKSR